MPHVLEIKSTLTDRYRTTIPEAVRRALHLNKRDKLIFSIRADGSVLLARAKPTSESDPAIGEFLHFLARDIAARPHAIRGFDGSLQTRLQALIGTVEVDLDAPLTDE